MNNLNSLFPPVSLASPKISQILIPVFFYLITTIIIEALFASLFKVKKRNLLIVVLAQIITNPAVVLVSNLVYFSSLEQPEPIKNYYIAMAIMEIIAITIEGFLFKFFFEDYKTLNPFILSLILNVISLSIGLIL